MRSRRLRVVGAISLASAVMLALVFIFVLYGPIARWIVRTQVLPKVSAKLGQPIDVGSIDVGRGNARLEKVSVGAIDGSDPLVAVARIEVEFDFWSSLTGSPDIELVRVVEPAVHLERGDARVDELVERFASSAEGTASDKVESRVGATRWPGKLIVEGGTLVAKDSGSGTVVTAKDIEATVTDGRATIATLQDVAVKSPLLPPAGAASLIVSSDRPGDIDSLKLEVIDGRLRLWPGMTLTGISGTVAPANGNGTVEVDLGGSYGGMKGRLWSAAGTVDPLTRTGALDIEAKRFQLAQLSSVLDGTGVVDPDQTTVAVGLRIEVNEQGAAFSGSAEIDKLNVFVAKVAEKPIRNIHAVAELSGEVVTGQRKLQLDRAVFRLGDVDYKLEGFVQLGDPAADPESRQAKRRLALHLVVPPVPCQRMLDSIPREFVPYLQGFKLKGTFDTDLRIAIDWADLDASELAGSVGIRGCKVVHAPAELSASRLKGSFQHWVEVEGGQWVSFDIGPENPDFVPFNDISGHLVKSIITTEDSRFFRHRGFIPSEFRSAMIKDLKAGYFKYGASSITMQMVKNVILYREKTVSRKVQELFFTWYLEEQLSKERIMEIYLNAIEYGPGLYGIGPAAEEYFGKHPRDLTPVEAAFFSSILPNPKVRYRQYCDGQLTRWTTGKIQRILKIMRDRDRLDEDEYMLAAVTPLEFIIRDNVSPAECKRRVKKFLQQKGASSKNPRKR